MDRLFTPKDNQQIVYDCVARPTVNDVMNGTNGTIIAYG